MGLPDLDVPETLTGELDYLHLFVVTQDRLREQFGELLADAPHRQWMSLPASAASVLVALRDRLWQTRTSIGPIRMSGAADESAATSALDVLVQAELQRRADARVAKDWATADAVRDRLAQAGIEVTDTPDGAQWALKGEA